MNLKISFKYTFFKGLLIGISNIIPGVSGGTMAVALGAYDELLLAINTLRKDWKKSLRLLLPYVLGAVFGIGALSFVIQGAMDAYPLIMACLFLGLILGGVPPLWQKAQKEKKGFSEALLFMLFMFLILFMTFVSTDAMESTTIIMTPLTFFILFVVGVIAAATMIIPGVSGSLVLILLGYYDKILTTLSTFIRSVFDLNPYGIGQGLLVILPFGLGILLGIGLVAKLIAWLFNAYPGKTYAAILGLVAASPIAIFYGLPQTTFTLPTAVFSILALALGYVLSTKLGEK